MKKAVLVAGLLYGDESKGATVEKLCEYYSADLVVRYSGGAQAAHNVVLSDGRHHTFRQFGCGTFQGIPTYLSRFHAVDLLELEKEAQALEALGVENPYALMYISEEALLVTPMHYKGDDDWRARTGIPTCGLGIGEARWYAQEFPEDALYIRDIRPDMQYTFKQKWWKMKKFYSMNEYTMPWNSIETLAKVSYVSESAWKRWMFECDSIIFEGAQGVQLDTTRGTVPYVTSSNTTYENALELLKDSNAEIERWGCIRTYATRHGAGPFPNESVKLLDSLPELHNKDNEFQGEWRAGYHDWNIIRSSIATLGGIDYLSVSHYDMFPYVLPDLHAPIGMKAYGPTKEDRRVLK